VVSVDCIALLPRHPISIVFIWIMYFSSFACMTAPNVRSNEITAIDRTHCVSMLRPPIIFAWPLPHNSTGRNGMRYGTCAGVAAEAIICVTCRVEVRSEGYIVTNPRLSLARHVPPGYIRGRATTPASSSLRSSDIFLSLCPLLHNLDDPGAK
jgi:hypothetical protein